MLGYYEWLILLFPLLGVLLNGLLGRRLGRRGVAWVACGSVALAFLVLLPVWIGFVIAEGERGLVGHPTPIPWLQVGDLRADLSLYLDPVSVWMALVVAGVGLLIHVYATGYMAGDARYARFFTLLNLFVFSMLLLVLAGNFLLLFVGWELVGVCSYLLIGFWFERPAAADAGKKAFLVTRLGDVGFVLGVVLIFWAFGTLDYDLVFLKASQLIESLGTEVFTAIALLLLAGAVGKSAQIPLYVWLPDAMEGPTPVSALIHAATMVTAGVYLIARARVFFVYSAVASPLVAWIGALTALFAATMALTQRDLKRILAYSTISQLGYMFLGVGVMGYAASLFHLTTHAFFKALLFLCAGAVMHALDGELDIFKMGGLREKLPTTYWTFVVGAAALAGIPPLSGFFSKDAILADAWRMSPWLWGVGVGTAFLTALYAFRMVFVVFWGEARVRHEDVHRPGRRMAVPLRVLAWLALLGGVLDLPVSGGRWLERFLSGSLGMAVEWEGWTEWALMGVSALVALAGAYVAYLVYVRRLELAEVWARRLGVVYRWAAGGYGVDVVYALVIVRPLRWLGRVIGDGVERYVLDGVVRGVGRVVLWCGKVSAQLQTGYLRGYLLALVAGIAVAVGYLVLAGY